MSIINLRQKTINAKIVYYGTALGGKTTSLKHVHRVIDPEQKVELVSLNTEKDRTLFFDFLPITLGKIGGFTVRLQGFTVPGQVKYNLTRKYVLTGADAVVLVVDSQRSQLDSNYESLRNLKENLAANGLDYRSLPLVIQYNKQDLSDLVPTAELEERLNDRSVPAFETVATVGTGVFEGFIEVTKAMLNHIADQYQIDRSEAPIAAVLEKNLLRLLERSRSGAEVAVAVSARSAEEQQDSPGPNDDSTEVSRPALVNIAEQDDEGSLPASEELLKKAVDSNIEIARLYSEVNEIKNRLRDRIRELSALTDVGRTLTSTLDVDRLLRTVLDSATSCLGTEYGSLMLVNRDGTGLIEKVVNGFLGDPLANTMLQGQGPSLLFHLAMQGDGLLVNDEEEGEILAHVREREPKVGSLMVAPLVRSRTVAGVLTVYFPGEGSEATRDRLRFLSALASHAAIALENARLITRIEGFNRELEFKVKERTAELRKAYDELMHVDRMKDDFLSSISHELLTPLTSIQSFSEILLDMTDPELTESMPEFLSIINQESQRLTQRLKLLLDLSQIEAGKVSFELNPVDLRDVASELFLKLRKELKAKSLETEIICPSEPKLVPCDRSWIALAIENLLANAVKFSEEGATIFVRIEEHPGEVQVSVQDEGPGIAPEYQKVVFERFKQIGDVLTEKPTGVGLGLPLTREIVERHGGRVWVESEPGEGARFILGLPLKARWMNQRKHRHQHAAGSA